MKRNKMWEDLSCSKKKLKLREKMINVKRIRKPKEGNSDRKVENQEQLRTIRWVRSWEINDS